MGKTKRGRGTKIMAVADGAGLPLAVLIESATPHEATLVQDTLAEIFVDEPLERLIGDNAYDSDCLDRALAESGVERDETDVAHQHISQRGAAHVRRLARRFAARERLSV